ncbi:YlcI/YnfO family protein [Enterobacter ludwigii]
MTKSTRNNKSEQRTVRIPLDVLSGIEQTQSSDESTGQYIVTALRGEIARRKLTENGSEKIMTDLTAALDTLARIEATSTRAGKELQEITSAAQEQLQKLRPGSEPAPARPKGKSRLLGQN